MYPCTDSGVRKLHMYRCTDVPDFGQEAAYHSGTDVPISVKRSRTHLGTDVPIGADKLRTPRGYVPMCADSEQSVPGVRGPLRPIGRSLRLVVNVPVTRPNAPCCTDVPIGADKLRTYRAVDVPMYRFGKSPHCSAYSSTFDRPSFSEKNLIILRRNLREGTCCNGDFS
jgi:hypothetical protein